MKNQIGMNEEKVTVRIPIDRSNPTENFVVVSVNGKNWKIKRGVNVEVPKYVARVLEWADQADEIAYNYSQDQETFFKSE